MNKAVFLDRDGTIIQDVGYISSPEQVQFVPGSIEAIKMLNQAGYKVIVITNQAGVARGITTEDMVQTVDKVIQRGILSGGAHLDGIYYCPHHPEHGVYPYKQICECRKPHTGLIKKATQDHQIDLGRSFMIGDKSSDVETGKRAGIRTVFVLTGHGSREKGELKAAPEYIARDLAEAVKWVLST